MSEFLAHTLNHSLTHSLSQVEAEVSSLTSESKTDDGMRVDAAHLQMSNYSLPHGIHYV